MTGELPVLVIDGSRFDDFAGFTHEFSTLLDDYQWSGNLDAFNDILHGGFGTPEDGFRLRWLESERSREVLGYDATEQWFQDTLERCHPSNRDRMRTGLEAARRHQGTTLFDWIVEIIVSHGSPQGGIQLELC